MGVMDIGWTKSTKDLGKHRGGGLYRPSRVLSISDRPQLSGTVQNPDEPPPPMHHG